MSQRRAENHVASGAFAGDLWLATGFGGGERSEESQRPSGAAGLLWVGTGKVLGGQSPCARAPGRGRCGRDRPGCSCCAAGRAGLCAGSELLPAGLARNPVTLGLAAVPAPTKWWLWPLSPPPWGSRCSRRLICGVGSKMSSAMKLWAEPVGCAARSPDQRDHFWSLER